MNNLRKNRIHFVVGLPFTGKTIYVRENFSDKQNYYILDYGEKFFELYGNYDDLNHNEKSFIVYEKMLHEIKDAVSQFNVTLVAEYCTGFHSSTMKLEKLIDRFEANNWKITVKQMHTGIKAHSFQQLAEEDPSYCPSLILNDHHYNLLNHYLDEKTILNK
jgi:hypothetical protein